MTTLSLAPVSARPAVRPRFARPRIPALPRGAHILSTLAVAILVTGSLVSILTTSDPLWWQLYFSQLGVFDDFSSRMFNGSVMVSGLLFASYGMTLHAELHAGVGVRTSRALRVSLVSIGANMIAIGLIPIPVSLVLHDLAAMGLALSLIALLCAGFGMRMKTRAVRTFLVAGAVLLVGGMIVLTLDLITLALYEAVAFSTLGVWLRLLPGLAALQPVPVTTDAVADGIRTLDQRQTPPLPSPSRSSVGSARIAPPRRPVGCRTTRVSRPASARQGAVPARAAALGTCSPASATSRPAHRGKARPGDRGDSMLRSRPTARRGIRLGDLRRDPFGSRFPHRRGAGSRR